MKKQPPLLLCALLCLLFSYRAQAATFTVTSTDDNGGITPAAGANTGTLRQAIVDAENTPGGDSINFDPAIFAAPRKTIELKEQLTINSSMSITGPEAGVVLDGDGARFLIKI